MPVKRKKRTRLRLEMENRPGTAVCCIEMWGDIPVPIVVFGHGPRKWRLDEAERMLTKMLAFVKAKIEKREKKAKVKPWT